MNIKFLKLQIKRLDNLIENFSSTLMSDELNDLIEIKNNLKSLLKKIN